MKTFNLGIILVATSLCDLVLSETVIVSIPDGQLKGQSNRTSRNNVTFYSFRGIPYARPPVEDLRFTDPLPNEPWNDTRDATYDRDQCLQWQDSAAIGSEDCLFVNVYTPDLNATDLAVLVWIHGGAFTGGNASYSYFTPDYLLEQGLVFVSISYRLGVLGFLSTEDDACPGNWGIKDQILALKWVQNNVAYFGGDPTNVTIYGESAGSVSVHLLLQTNLTEGLFKGAIMNSGTTLNLWALNTRARETANLIGSNLAVFSDNSTELVANLRRTDAEKLLSVASYSASALFVTNALRGLPFGPVLEPDIDGAVYTKPSCSALSDGDFLRVPVLMGLNSNEAAAVTDIPWYIRTYLLYYDVTISNLTPFNLSSDYLARYVAATNIKYRYFKLQPIAASSDNLITYVSSDQFNRPIRKAATEMAKYTDVYFYKFGYMGGLAGIEERTFSGVSHAEDNCYIGKCAYNGTESDVKVSETLVLLWSNFAKFGTPTPYNDTRLNYTFWQPVNASETDFNYMSLNESIALAVNPKQADWEYFKDLWEEYWKGGELSTY